MLAHRIALLYALDPSRMRPFWVEAAEALVVDDDDVADVDHSFVARYAAVLDHLEEERVARERASRHKSSSWDIATQSYADRLAYQRKQARRRIKRDARRYAFEHRPHTVAQTEAIWAAALACVADEEEQPSSATAYAAAYLRTQQDLRHRDACGTCEVVCCRHTRSCVVSEERLCLLIMLAQPRTVQGLQLLLENGCADGTVTPQTILEHLRAWYGARCEGNRRFEKRLYRPAVKLLTQWTRARGRCINNRA